MPSPAPAARPPALPLARKLALGAGDFGFNLYWTTTSLFLLYVYTDVLKLPAATAGLIYMVALLWDATIDPLIGAVADRTRTRFGRYRPYLMLGGVPLAFSFALVFMGPVWPAAGAALFAGATHLVFRTLYSVVSIPYTALFARVTRDSGERADLAGVRMVAATLSALTIALLTLPLVQTLGHGDARRGWAMVAALYGAGALALFWLVAWAARGLDAVDAAPRAAAPWRDTARAVGTNTPLLIALALFVVSTFGNTFFQNNLIYYFKYVLGAEKLASLAFALIALVLACLVPAWVWAAKRFGKRRAWLVGAGFHLAGLVAWRLADGHGTAGLFGALAVSAVGTASAIVCLWAILPDTVEFGEWRSGVRTESLVFGLVTLGQKAALGLSGWSLGLALKGVGYTAGATQTPATLHGLKDLMLFVPVAGGLIGVVLICFYRLDGDTHRRIVDEIAAREAAAKVTASL